MTWRLCECRSAWGREPDLGPVRGGWPGKAARGQRLLVAVNYGPTQAQCWVSAPVRRASPAGSSYADVLGEARYERDGAELAEGRGSLLDLPPWGRHAFAVEPGEGDYGAGMAW